MISFSRLAVIKARICPDVKVNLKIQQNIVNMKTPTVSLKLMIDIEISRWQEAGVGV